MQRLAILAALLSACCTPRTVTRPIVIEPPSCRERDHPEPPNAEVGSQAWADWFALELVPWVLEVEAACPRRVRGAVEPIGSRSNDRSNDDAPWQAGYP